MLGWAPVGSGGGGGFDDGPGGGPPRTNGAPGLGLARRDVRPDAVGDQSRRDHEPDTPRSARHDGDLAVEAEQVGERERRAGIRHAGSMAHDDTGIPNGSAPDGSTVLETRGTAIGIIASFAG